MLELAEMVRDAVGSSSRIRFDPLPADDPRRRRPDVTRAREILGRAPAVPLAEGLARTVDHFRAIVE